MRSRQSLSDLATVMGGLPILGCLEGSPAAEAGLRYGDILLSIDNKPTSTWDDYMTARGEVSGRFVARIFREGVELELLVVLRPSNLTPTDVLAEMIGKQIASGSVPAGEAN